MTTLIRISVTFGILVLFSMYVSGHRHSVREPDHKTLRTVADAIAKPHKCAVKR